MIDTSIKPERRRKMEVEPSRVERSYIDPERARLAQTIFGEVDDDFQTAEESKKVDEAMLEEVFNADEIDDPFSSAADKEIAEKDIPERLQVKLAGRLTLTPEELAAETDWVLDTLIDPEGPYGQEYNSRFQTRQEVRVKIQKVLQLIHDQKLDVPMIVKYRKFEYASELDEKAVWAIFNLDQEFGKFQKHKA